MVTRFFALIIKDKVRTIQRIDLNQKTSNALNIEFEKQKNYFLHEKEEQDFTGTYKLEKGEIFCIKKFTLEPDIQYTLKNPTSGDSFQSVSNNESIKTIFAIQYNEHNIPTNILFQTFVPSRIIDRDTLALFWVKNNFSKISKFGIVIAKKLDAIYYCQQKSLYFYSYSNVRQFLNLDQYFHEATDEEIKKIFKDKDNPVNAIGGVNHLLTLCDSVSRKKFTQINSSEILKNVKLSKIEKEAKKLKITINTSNGKLDFPNDKKELKELLYFLAEDIYIGPLSDKRFISNSKKTTN
jgi:hypothetical protein